MRSETASIISAFDDLNAPLGARTDGLLAELCARPDQHWRFQNTLAMLEHMGSQKIMATQQGRAIDQPTLKHLAEEARHAFFFKRQAETLAGRDLAFGPGETLAATPAWFYFQRLEGAVVAALTGAPRAALYLTTSMVIEFRAVWAYRRYQQALDQAGIRLSLKSLLAEEQGHLTDMADRLDALGAFDSARLHELLAVETRLYGRLLSAFERAIGPQARAA